MTVDELSPREREILKLLAEGFYTDEIARDLGLSKHTVRVHRTNILTKLGVHSMVRAVALFVAHDRDRRSA